MMDRRPMPVFCFTIDMDWAPQAVIDDTLALFWRRSTCRRHCS